MNENIIISDRSKLNGLVEIDKKIGRTEEISAQLSRFVVGQGHAISAVAKALALAEAGLNDPDRPVAVFFFTGPTGVGKTELARSIAKVFCGGEGRLKIIDCSLYSQDHTVHNLTGAPPSYVGSGETGKIPHDWLHAQNSDNQREKSVIVLDEIEKAHIDLQRLLLGALDRGTMDARHGDKGVQPLDFRDTVFVFTSNAGADAMQTILAGKEMGFSRRCEGGTIDNGSLTKAAINALEKVCSPEFLNRIGRDRTIVFEPLTEEQYPQVLIKLIEAKNTQISRGFQSKNRPPYQLYVTQEFADWITSQLDKRYGARDLRNILETRVYPELAECLSSLEISGGVVMDFSDCKLRFLRNAQISQTENRAMSA